MRSTGSRVCTRYDHARVGEKRRELIHIRTGRNSPNQVGAPGRVFGSLKHEHLYLLEIDDGQQLAGEAERYRQLFNEIGPHEALAMRRPTDVPLEAVDHEKITKSNEPETLPTP